MHLATPAKNTTRNLSQQLAKIAILLGISLGLLSIVDIFSQGILFEPESTGWILGVSYANDLILPFALYFFICLGERWLRTWRERALLTFTIFVILELGQALFHRIPYSQYVGTFDLIDILMYAISVGLAVTVEQRVFAKLLKFW